MLKIKKKSLLKLYLMFLTTIKNKVKKLLTPRNPLAFHQFLHCFC